MDIRFTFFSVDVEISNRCDVGCLICARSKITRPKGLMDRATFANIIRTLSPLKSRVTLCGLGNPVANPHWSDFVLTYKKIGGKIGLVIHCSHLSDQVISDLCRIRPDFLEISFPSVAKEHFGSLCPHSNYDAAHAAVLRLIDEARKLIPIAMIGIRTGINPNEETVFREHWQNANVQTRVFPCHSRGGSLTDQALLSSPITRPPCAECGLLGMHSFVTWEGKLLACCHDLTGDTEMGDFNRESLQTLLDRKATVLKRANPFSICADCDDPYRLIEKPTGPFPESNRARQKVLRRLAKKTS